MGLALAVAAVVATIALGVPMASRAVTEGPGAPASAPLATSTAAAAGSSSWSGSGYSSGSTFSGTVVMGIDGAPTPDSAAVVGSAVPGQSVPSAVVPPAQETAAGEIAEEASTSPPSAQTGSPPAGTSPAGTGGGPSPTGTSPAGGSTTRSPATTSRAPAAPASSAGSASSATGSASPATGSVSSATGSTSPAAESEVLALVNRERADAGCDPLAADPGLAGVARAHSADMRDRNFFSHVNPDGLDPFERAERAGIDYARAENIAYGQPDAAAVVRAWMKSAGHRANIVDCDLRRLGVGVAEGPGGLRWTQLFGA